MAILINDNYSLQAVNKAFDARYLDINTPWASCAAAIAGIPTYRYPGLTINIANVEWWWKDGIGDGDLVQKSLGGSSNLSGATNGLQLLCSNTYVGLGGALTQNTTICGAHILNLGNATSGLTALCGVTPEFYVGNGVLSGTSICFQHDQNTPHFDVCLYANNANSCAGMILDVDVNEGYFNAYNAPNSTCCSSICLQTTDSNVAVYNLHSTNCDAHYVTEACLASAKLSCQSITDIGNSALNIKSVMDYDTRSFEFCKDDSVILSILSGGTARYGSNVTLTNDCDLVHKWYVDNSAGALSGANGLTKDGNNIVLGGTLTGNTCVVGGGNVLCLLNNTAYAQLGSSSFNVSGSTIAFTEAPQNKLVLNASGFGVESITTFLCGAKYFSDLSSAYTARSIPDVAYVTGITSGFTGAITAANNGLTKSGTTVSLGGALTGITNITGSYPLSLGTFASKLSSLSGYASGIYMDGTACVRLDTTNGGSVSQGIKLCHGDGMYVYDVFGAKGLEYCANYSTNSASNPRWIPDNAYVTGLTLGHISTASNGLTKVGQDVKLGGTLTGNTDICLGGATPYSLCVKNSGVTTCTVAEFAPTTISLCASNVNSPFQTSRLTTSTSGTVMCHGFANCYSCMNMSNSLIGIWLCGGANNASFTVTDATTNKRGIEYAADYSATFSDCSLVTKQYVSGVTSGITGAITSANNGLTKVGQNVVLGGNLTGATIICGNGNNLCFSEDGGNTLYTFSCDWVNTQVNTGLTYTEIDTTYAAMYSSDAAGCYARIHACCDGSALIEFNTCAIIYDASGTQEGLVYNGDYESTFQNRSLVTKQYVTSQVSGITANAITGATNGICTSGQDVLLGGTLTEWTTISMCDDTIGMDLGSSGGEMDTFQVGAWNFQLHNTCGGICFISNNGNTPYYKMEGYDTTGNQYIYDEYDITNGACYNDFGTANLRCYSKTVDLCSTTALDEQLYVAPAGAMYWKCVQMNESLLNSVAVHERLSQATGLTNNIATSMCWVDRSWNLCVDNALHFSILSGGTARYGTATSAACITNNADLTNKIYVDTCVNSLTGTTSVAITGATNGLCKVGQDVILGGELTGDTTIGGAHTMAFNNTAFKITGNTTIDGGFQLSTGASVNFIETSLTNDDTRLPTSGAVFDAISSANISAGNGLTAVGTYVELGGILTGATTISGGSQTLRLGHSSSCLSNLYIDASGAVQIQSSSIYTNALTSANYKGGNFCIQLDNNNATFCDNSGGKDGLKYAACISTGFTNSCSVVDKGYVDDKSNTVEVCNVVTNYTASTTNDFIGVSGATEVWLPSAPKPCQRIIVADICGNALVSNICIIGNGLCINGNDGATINTEYGAMTFINNGYSWSAVAFIN